jgi:hypothetical protein
VESEPNWSHRPEPAPIIITIDRLDIRLGESATPVSSPATKGSAVVMPLETFLRRAEERK